MGHRRSPLRHGPQANFFGFGIHHRHGDEKQQHLHRIGTILLRECRDRIRDDKHFRAFVVNRTWGQYHHESGGLLPSIEDRFYVDGTMCDLVQGCGNILVHFAFERWCRLGDICQTTVQGRVGRSTRRVDRNNKTPTSIRTPVQEVREAIAKLGNIAQKYMSTNAEEFVHIVIGEPEPVGELC